MLCDTSLLRMVIEDLAELKKWTFEETFDKFYNSKTCKLLSDRETGVFTFAPREVILMYDEKQ